MPSLIGQILKGRYRVEESLGRGGMAEVYKAWDNQRRYHVAVKVLREDLAEDREFDRRFRREAEALAALAHRNIVRFYSFERDGPLAFIVMDVVAGTTLRRRIFDAGGPLPLDEVGSILEQVVAALAYAHSQGVLHRDVKPGNIMIEPGGRALVADFGIAKAADAATMTTVMPGTPAYMSPEQCRSEPLDARTDVYSLGIVAYEMLAGERPFVGDSEAATGTTGERIRWEQLHADPPPLRRRNPAVPSAVEAVALRALAKEPEERWPTVLAFWQALEAALAGVRPEAVAGATAAEPIPVPPKPQPMAPSHPRAAPPAAEPQPAPATPAAPVAPPEVAAPAYRPPQQAGLPAWAWALAGLLLAGLVILALALGGGGGRRSTPTALAVVQTTTAPAPSLGDRWTRRADEMEMVYVPAGEFEMGSNDGESDERPVHPVYLDGFWIDRTEVSNAQFAAFLNTAGNQTEGGATWLDLGDGDCRIQKVGEAYQAATGYGDHPVIEVTWYGAAAYCAWAGARLPTEAEWEVAARGLEEQTYPWGNEAPDCDRANYGDCVGGTIAVGSYPAGASWVGALDPAGNVWEWVADWYGEYPAGRQENPTGPASGGTRVLRGGSWFHYPSNLRCANRLRAGPDVADNGIGFRCARGSP